METKISLTDGNGTSVALPPSALEMVMARNGEVVAYFTGANETEIRVVVDMEDLRGETCYTGARDPHSAAWVYDRLYDPVGDRKVKKIQVLSREEKGGLKSA